MESWEHFSHGSDVGVRGIGATLSKSFEMIGVALTSLMGDPSSIQPVESIEFDIQSESLDFLLYDWVNRLIYETVTRKILFSQFSLEIGLDQKSLHAKMMGEKINILKHRPGVEVKGATFTELKVTRSENLWICQCVVDV